MTGADLPDDVAKALAIVARTGAGAALGLAAALVWWSLGMLLGFPGPISDQALACVVLGAIGLPAAIGLVHFAAKVRRYQRMRRSGRRVRRR